MGRNTGIQYKQIKTTHLYIQNILKKPGIVKSGDFLDCIDKDLPQGVWSVRFNDANTIAYVANNFWNGYHFYTVVAEGEFGGVYFGNGTTGS